MMRHHTIGRTLFWLLLGLGVGAVVSYWLTHTPYPAIVFLSLALILGIILLCWKKISEPYLRKIKNNLQMKVKEIVTDAKYERTTITFEVSYALIWKVAFMSFKNCKVSLDAEEVSQEIKLLNPDTLKKPLTSFTATIKVLPKDIKRIQNKQNNEKGHWSFGDVVCLLDTRWGEMEWEPEIPCFTQSKRIGNF
jgi:hypothetical protein